MDLYRVGVPSIGEVWGKRFTYNRSSGGLGTGVYAFRDRAPAESNITRSSPGSELYVLENALENPVQPRTRDATDALARVSRYMDLLYGKDNSGEYTFDDAIARLESGMSPYASLTSFMSDTIGYGDGKPILDPARTALFETPELRERYGYDTEEFLIDFVRATRRAGNEYRRRSDTAVQPINVLLYPEYDGVAPVDGAGGNTGRHGCVVFKQKIDECVGRTTESFDEVPAEKLNRCFASP
jgi:hypothetical protein